MQSLQGLTEALKDLDYPGSDGEPMGETDIHRDLMTALIEALKAHYQADPNVYVSGNIILYYEEGNPQVHISPDVLITLGVSKEPRETYLLWRVGKPPDLVVEVTSKSTRMRDIGVKKGLYEALGVQEYILFDPCSEYLVPRFQVFRLTESGYVPCLVPEPVGYESALGLTFRVVDNTLRILDTATGSLLPIPAEMAAATQAERERADSERERADQLAQKLRELGVDPDSL